MIEVFAFIVEPVLLLVVVFFWHKTIDEVWLLRNENANLRGSMRMIRELGAASMTESKSNEPN